MISIILHYDVKRTRARLVPNTRHMDNNITCMWLYAASSGSHCGDNVAEFQEALFIFHPPVGTILCNSLYS